MTYALPWEIEQSTRKYEEAATRFAVARVEEQKLEDERHVVKQRVIARLMATDNAETGKQHSATSAEKVVNLDPEYAEYLARQRSALLEKDMAFSVCESARIRALAFANMAGQIAVLAEGK